jgi:hypothetical protein
MEAGRVGEGGKKPFLEWKTEGRCGASRWSAKRFLFARVKLFV